jgi:hypothetical protein
MDQQTVKRIAQVAAVILIAVLVLSTLLSVFIP